MLVMNVPMKNQPKIRPILRVSSCVSMCCLRLLAGVGGWASKTATREVRDEDRDAGDQLGSLMW